jgi:hypothetical protein
MNAVINEIYKDWSGVEGKENISFTLALKADALLSELDYYPSYIWNTEGKIIFEYRQLDRSLYIFVDEHNVSGKKCAGKHTLEEYVYLTVSTTNTVLDRFWE